MNPFAKGAAEYHPTEPALMHGLIARPGRRYSAQVEIRFPASLAASVAVVRSLAEAIGFTKVEVYERKPEDFPGPDYGADYYVRGHYAGLEQSFERMNHHGLVNVLAAWEE